MSKPVVLVILDGWGIGREWEHNPIHLAETPTMDYLQKEYPFTTLGASGPPVGLRPGQIGSSEVGHLVIGAGRNVPLPQNQILDAVESGDIFENKAYKKAFQHVKKTGGTVHMVGLLSDIGIHSYNTTCHALVEMAKKEGVEDNLAVHVITDGRDAPPKSALTYLEQFSKFVKELGISKALIASVTGRFFAMDRDQRWDRTEKAYHAMVYGRGVEQVGSAVEAVQNAYERDEIDEFIAPTVILNDDGKPRARVNDGDAIIHWNFRADRAVQFTESFLEDHFEGFPREEGKPDVLFVGTNEYYDDMDGEVAFARPEVKNTFGEVCAKNDIRQFRVTETEKWAHLTFFFNGIRDVVNKHESRTLIPSDKIATYDAAPDMQAEKIADQVVETLKEEKADVVLINFANPDMLGHTGVKEAIIKGVEAVDVQLKRVVDATLEKNGSVLIIADHGNAELNYDEEVQQQHTAHTMARVPCIVVSEDAKLKQAELEGNGALQDVAPTLLDLLGIEKPKEMTGKSVIIKK